MVWYEPNWSDGARYAEHNIQRFSGSAIEEQPFATDRHFRNAGEKIAMKAGRPKMVINPYDWLPSYGENAVTLCTKGGDLSLIIGFDGADGGISQREFLFKGMSAFMQTAIPGINWLGITYSENDPSSLSALIEYPESEAALAWTRHYGDGRIIRHYRIVFLSENTLVEVFARECVLGEIVNLAH
jgi:hypothetical protein